MKAKLKKFRVYAPPDVKSYGLNEDGTLTVTGIASTTNEDLDGEIVSPDALKSLAKQVIGLNLHLDHDHSYKGGIGAITDATLENSSLRITAVILPEFAEGILERLDLGMNFGFSIGGIPVIDSLNSRVINDFILLEVSLTLLPANWDTFGTVEVTKGLVESRCLTGACHYILKEKKSDNMSKKEANNPIEVTDEIKQELVNIVNEAVYNLKPQLLDELRGEIGPVVQDVITEVLPQLLPPEVKDADIEDEEIIEESEEEIEEFDAETAIEEETDEVEEVTAEPPIEAEEEKACDDEEVKAETEETEEEPVAEEEDVVEEEKEVTDEPIDGESTEEDADYVETTQTADTPKVIVDVKSIADKIVKEVKADLYKEFGSKKTTKKSTKSSSKLNQYKKSKNTASTKSKSKFLDSEERDHLGRNRKYI